MVTDIKPRLTKSAKRLPDHINKRAPMLGGLVALLLLGSALMQSQLDPDVRKLHQGEGSISTASGGLNNEFLLLPLLGFREAAAGLLWVRCDEFFHSGDYDAILPLVRLITILDPHAENVYITGAWHLSYNFTDSSERSDKRYIAPALALLQQGIDNNMSIPDIKFEMGWQNYDKVKDFPAAERAFKLAIAGPKGDETGIPDSDDFPYAAPLKTLHTLAHTYEKEGRIPEALAEWKLAMKRSEEVMAANRGKKKPEDSGIKQLNAAEHHNYEETLQRYHDRYLAESSTIKHDAKVNPSPLPAVLAPPPGSSDQTPRPWDVAMKTQIDLVRPKVFKVSGEFNAADGSRVDLSIADWDEKVHKVAASQTTFEVDFDQTILIDSISVRKNKFSREIDMSKDPKMYGFKQDFYRIVLSFNARTTSPHVHDRFGWSGEGLTDSNAAHIFINRNPLLLGTKMIENKDADGAVWDGVTAPWNQSTQSIRQVRVTYKVTKAQIENRKPITDADIIPNEQ